MGLGTFNIYSAEYICFLFSTILLAVCHIRPVLWSQFSSKLNVGTVRGGTPIRTTRSSERRHSGASVILDEKNENLQGVTPKECTKHRL
ncbi:hypothetical protein AB1N83_007321 [Pleurotus pulmonarius]